MKIVLFCEQKYAINILQPLEVEANKKGEHSVIWYVQPKNISHFPLKDEVKWTNNIQEIYDFSPDAIFVPCNIVPYYLPGVKIQIFHGYAAEKKDHWVIRRYFDTYFTQGPFFTEGFKALAQKYKDFEVVETGWPRQDWIHENLHTFDTEKNTLLRKYHKNKLVLYAPTFSPSLTSLPFIKEGLEKLAREKDVLLILKFHPLTRREWMEEYRQLAEEYENMLWVEDHNITKYQLMADVMISDTSSTVYEFLLLDKPLQKIFTGRIFRTRKTFPTLSISYSKMPYSHLNANGSSITTIHTWTEKSAIECSKLPEIISPATGYPGNGN